MSTERFAERPEEDPFWMPLVERRIREAMGRGEFDDLPGAGRPIPDVDVVYDPLWWVRNWIQRERLRDLAGEVRKARTVVRARRDPGGHGVPTDVCP